MYDSNCDEPVLWGFKIIKYMSDEKFNELKSLGKLMCIGIGEWYHIEKHLTRDEAIEKYGSVTNENIVKPRKNSTITFGNKTFFISNFNEPNIRNNTCTKSSISYII